MDRTTSRRMFNEFSSEVDLNSPDGMLRSKDVDSYIENALKPLFEEGKAFKQVRVNRRTGARTTRYAFQGGKKIQDSVKAVLDNMHAALGYDVDPATGNVKGTNAPPPMSITDLGRHNYNETRERILDPRTAASIKAQALRAGGVSTTDKATGFTTTLVRAGLSGETRVMRKLVDDSDQKYLEGQLPSSALADGASPASVQERARAKVNRREAIRNAEQQAKADYIARYPDSWLAVNEAAKMQRVTDRETKQRMLEKERTPGTGEFQGAVDRRLNKRLATNSAMLSWAKRNKGNPLAKQILKRSKGNGILSKAVSMAKFGAISALLTVITTAVGAMVKLLTSLPNIANNVRKLATKGAQYNISNNLMEKYEKLADILHINKDSFKEVQGAIYETLVSVINGDPEKVLSKIAATSGLSGGRSISAVTDYFIGKIDNPDPVMVGEINDLFKASFDKILLQGGTAKTSNQAFSVNLRDYDETHGLAKIAPAMYRFWQSLENRPADKDMLEEAGKNGRFFEALLDYIAGKSASDFAGGPTTLHAEQVGRDFNTLVASMKQALEGVLINITSSMDPVVKWLETIYYAILKFANKLPGVEGMFTAELLEHQEKTIDKNMQAKAYNEAMKAVLDAETLKIRQKFRLPGNDEAVKRTIDQIERGVLPVGMTKAEADNYYLLEKFREKVAKDAKVFENKKVMTGETGVPNINPIAYADYISRLPRERAARQIRAREEIVNKYGIDSAALTSAREDQQDKLRIVESMLNAAMRGHGNLRAAMEKYPKLLKMNAIAVVDEAAFNAAIKELEAMKYNILGNLEAIKAANTDTGFADINTRIAGNKEIDRQARQEGEIAAIKAQIVGIAESEGVLGALLAGISNNTVRVEVHLDAEKREYSFKIVDSHGNILLAKDTVTSPNIKTSIRSNNLFASSVEAPGKPSDTD